VGIFRRRRVVVARPLVAKRASDDDKIWRSPGRHDLARGSQTDQQAASAGEKLFRNQYGESGADCPSDDSDLPSGEGEDIELGVVARPAFERPGLTCSAQMAHKIAVWIEQANGGNLDLLDVLLAPRFAHQRCRCENRGHRWVLVFENGGRSHLACTSKVMKGGRGLERDRSPGTLAERMRDRKRG